MNPLIGRRKRGAKIRSHHIAKMQQIAKSGMDQGLDLESASVDNYGDSGQPTMSVRFRAKGRKRDQMPSMPPMPKMKDQEDDGDE